MFDLFKNTLVSELAKAITEKGTECKNTKEDVFEKLPFLYEEIVEEEFGQKTGNIKKYLPKRYKEMVMRLISPMSSIISRPTYFDDHVRVDSSLFFDRCDDKPIASAVGYFYFSKITDADPDTVKSVAESAARGIAESRCLEKFGIGSWFERGFQPEDAPEEFLDKQDKNSDFKPDIPAQPEAPTNVEEKSEEKPTEEPSTSTKENPTPEKKKRGPKKSTTISSLDLEEVLALPAEIGIAKNKGYSLGDVVNNCPLNLRWMYVQKDISPEGKAAIKRIALSDEKIKASFEEYGLL